MTLRQKQSAFASLVAQLILQANSMGYEITLGEAYRSPEEARRLFDLGVGVLQSNHTLKLAIDLNLFRDGKYLTSTEAHRPLGLWWERQSTADYNCRWGGYFVKKDGNHYSIEHNGKA